MCPSYVHVVVTVAEGLQIHPLYYVIVTVAVGLHADASFIQRCPILRGSIMRDFPVVHMYMLLACP